MIHQAGTNSSAWWRSTGGVYIGVYFKLTVNYPRHIIRVSYCYFLLLWRSTSKLPTKYYQYMLPIPLELHHKLTIYVDRPTEHSLPLPKMSNLSSDWEVGWFCGFKKIYSKLFMFCFNFFIPLNLSLFRKFV